MDNIPEHIIYNKQGIIWHKENTDAFNKWRQRFYNLAKHIATWSKDSSTQVGAVIISPDKRIITTGYNGMPSRVNDNVQKRWKRPEKYFWVEHAERNAIYQAAKYGISIKGCTMYITMFPCSDCARAIIQSGIKDIVTPYYGDDQRWLKSSKIAEEMLIEAQIDINAIIWW